MKKTLILYSLLLIMLFPGNVEAVELNFDEFFTLIINYLGEDDRNENLDFQDLQEKLKEVYENPLNWNEVTRSQLEELQFINDKQIEELLFYSDYYGPVHSISELRLVEGIESPMLLLLPSVLCVRDIEDSIKWNDAFNYTQHKVLVRADYTPELKEGLSKKIYKGNNFRLITKYKFQAGHNFRAGLSMESDVGEPWSGYKRKGFDLYRAYVELSNLPYLGRITLGSYRAKFGKGLLFGQQNFGNRLNQVNNSINSSFNISSYGGISELPVLNGVSISVPINKINFSVFYGFTFLDSDTTGGVWKSYSKTGYHRTRSEIMRENTLHMNTIGANFLYRNRAFHIGTTIYGGFFSLPSVRGMDKWNAYDFLGKNQWGVSLNYAFNRKRINFSGETALCQGLGVATYNSIQIYFLQELFFTMNYRYISPKYHSFWSQTSNSLSIVNGEHGASFTMQIPVGRSKRISFLGDIFKPLWPTNYYSVGLGYELYGEFIGRLTQNVNIYTYIKYKNRPRWRTTLSKHEYISRQDRVGTLSLKLLYKAYLFDFQSGMQFNLAIEDKDNMNFGWLCYQDIACKFKTIPLNIKLRLSLFDAPTWSNRFYLYESDVPESGFSPALYGAAFKWYLNLNYQFKFGLNAAVRVSQIIHTNRQTIGSGLDQIKSNHRTDLHFYISYRIKSYRHKVH